MAGHTSKNLKRRAEFPALEDTIKKNKVVEENAGTVTPSALSLALGTTNLVFPMTPRQVAARAKTQDSVTPTLTTGMITMSPYGETYQHSGSSTSADTFSRRAPGCGLKIGGVAFERVNLNMPENLSKEEQNSLKLKWESELKHQEANPPALPKSQIQALPPKQMTDAYVFIPENLSDKEKKPLREYNNKISEQVALIDRRRNNQAAKKSRETRLEALKFTRQILNDKSAECAWMRLKIIELGGSTEEWDNINAADKRKMVDVVEERVKESDLKRAEDKKKEETQRRAERSKARAEYREQRGREAASSAPPAMSNSPNTMPTALPTMDDGSSDFLDPGL